MPELGVTSTGGKDQIESRGGRSMFTAGRAIHDPAVFMQHLDSVRLHADEQGSRRYAVRAVSSTDTLKALEVNGITPSVDLPLDRIGIEGHHLITVDHNVVQEEVPEWVAVWEDIHKVKKDKGTPEQQVVDLEEGYYLTRHIAHSDFDELKQLWKPFGWTDPKLRAYINTYADNQDTWMSVVRGADDKIASINIAEALNLELSDGTPLPIVETTEFGTMPQHRFKNLNAVALIGLTAQVLDATQYRHGVKPLVYGEYSMEPISRSYNVGMRAGYEIPGVTDSNSDRLTTPIQVLKRNVTVLDGGSPTDFKFGQQTAEFQQKHRDAFRGPHRFLRNFIVGMLPGTSVSNYYSPEQTQRIMSHYKN